MLTGVQITRKNGQLGNRPSLETGVSGLIAQGVAVDGGAQLSTTYELLSLADAVALGLDAAYDTTHKVLVHERIKRYFAFTAAPLWLRLVAQSFPMADMLNPEEEQATALLNDAEGKIRQLAVCLNPDGDYDPDIDDGLDEDSYNAIEQAKALRDWAQAEYMPVCIWIEGRSWTGSVSDLRDLKDDGEERLDAFNISVVLAQDPDVAALDALYEGYADVGTALGMESRRTISQHIGQAVADCDVSNAAQGFYQTVGLSGGVLLSSLDTPTLTALDGKGYVFLRRYKDYAGVYFEKDPCATPITDDFANRRFCRLWNEGYRLAYKALLPEVKGTVPTNPRTGRILDTKVAHLASVLAGALKPLLDAGHATGMGVQVSDLLRNEAGVKYLDFEFDLVPVDSADVISGRFGLALTV